MKNRNCPNCGAPYEIGLNKCPYCGTIYFDFSIVDFDNKEPIFLSIKNNGILYTMKVIPSCGKMELTSNGTDVIGWNGARLSKIRTSADLDVEISFKSAGSYDSNTPLFVARRGA